MNSLKFAPSTSSVITAETFQLDSTKAIHELYQQFAGHDIGFILFFCSSAYPLAELELELKRRFQHLEVMGCTTAGEIGHSGYNKNSISAIGFLRRDFSISGMQIPLENFTLESAQKSVAELITRCKSQMKAPIENGTFVLTLIDGLTSQEESVLLTLNTALGRIPHFGGSAGDDERLSYTHVYSDGVFHEKSALVIMVNTHCPFEVFSTHHIESLGSKLVVTKADSEHRRVYEFNAEPAALVYAREIGLDVNELRPEIYALNPLAVKVGNEFYVRSIQKVNPDLSLDFYCAVDNGIVVTAMKPGNVIDNLSQKLTKVSEQLGEIQLIIGCDCFLRRKEVEVTHRNQAMQTLLRRFHVVGFNTYGEQLGGIHVNQTFTGVAIGAPASLELISIEERKAG
ncbi:nitric oxide-sensing protein NosP [Vibrio mimicus]|uniref:nitric oxide-sensing protein NosP n=1 Tax=Vibrio mimicus TaxID=674 RepID=UPI00076B6349|nr:nitric oxide-sensing protein NosP [Vibrio mimicus]AMG04485.1 GfdT protein [Vibrio mimicus]KAA3491484.1 GfdT protein [Vibrio mimicus]